MSDLTNTDYRDVTRLFSEGLADSPLPIRAYMGQKITDATLNNKGFVDLKGNRYSDIQEAMEALGPVTESTSSAWQFWVCYSEERQAWVPLEHLRARLDKKTNQDNTVKTSITHPLRIDTVFVPGLSGRIGLTFCPGKCTEGLYGGTWRRDVSLDLDMINTWGGNTLISLMEQHEFSLLGVPNFSTVMANTEGLEWLHLPIRDIQVPENCFESRWATVGPDIHRKLGAGESVVIHCRGGLGRTGLLAARILVEAGVKPVEAVATVRQARERSIETYSQEHYVLTKAWQDNATD